MQTNKTNFVEDYENKIFELLKNGAKLTEKTHDETKFAYNILLITALTIATQAFLYTSSKISKVLAILFIAISIIYVVYSFCLKVSEAIVAYEDCIKINRRNIVAVFSDTGTRLFEMKDKVIYNGSNRFAIRYETISDIKVIKTGNVLIRTKTGAIYLTHCLKNPEIIELAYSIYLKKTVDKK